jgi:hypothetical protein
MAHSLIDDLQLDAADASVSVSTLLRKALVVAARLGVEDVPEWINRELSGYYGVDEIPRYRIVRGRVRAKLMHRLIDVQFDTNEFEKNVSERRIDSSIADLESMLSEEGTLTITYPAEAQAILRQIYDSPGTQFLCVIERARIASILDQIRNEVLRWAIALDKAGVRGEGLSFSQVEKEKAHGIVVHNAGAITIGNIGDVSNHSNVAAGHHPQVGSLISSTDLQALLKEVRTYIPSIIEPADGGTSKLNTALAELDEASQLAPVTLNKVRPPLHRILEVLGNMSQTVITTGLKLYIEVWMKSHGIDT